MIITVDRKRKEFIDVYPSINSFINYLRENYNKLNFENELIKSSIRRVYDNLSNSDGNILKNKFSRILHNKFGFKYKNILQKNFWIERGFSEEWYVKYLKDIQKSRGKSISKTKNINKEKRKKLNMNLCNLFKYKYTYFISDEEPICNNCKSNLNFLKRNNKDNGDYWDILECLNDKCETKRDNSYKLHWKSFLPSDVCDKLINKSVENMKNNNCLNPIFYVKRDGISFEEANKLISAIQSDNSKKVKNRFIASKENLRNSGYSEEEISNICKTPSMVEFWIDKGFSEHDAVKKVSDNSKYATTFIDYEKTILPSNNEYWLERGYSEEESKLKVSERQTTFSKKICIEKHGEKRGLEVFNDRQEKWQKSLNKNGNIKGGYSKISQELFNILNEMIDGEFKYALNGGEYRLIKDGGGIWLYDFTDLNRMKIIEYQGDMYHANPLTYKSDDTPHPFRKEILSSEIWEKDRLKMNVALREGYEVLYVWDSEFRRVSKKRRNEIIERCINFILK